MIAADNLPVQVACRVLGVLESGLYEHRDRTPSQRADRHAVLTDLIRQVSAESKGPSTVHRVHAELTLGRGVQVGRNQVEPLMRCHDGHRPHCRRCRLAFDFGRWSPFRARLAAWRDGTIDSAFSTVPRPHSGQMIMRPAVVVAVLLGILLAMTTPAQAERLAVSDPRGDRETRGLDMVGISVDNRDFAVVVRVRFTRSVRGDVIVSVDPRRATGVRLISEYRPSGEIRNYVEPFAFSDVAARSVACAGFRVRWLSDRPVVRMRMPARCLNGGSYGAIRFAVLTERGASDTDYAPGVPPRNSRWVPRG